MSREWSETHIRELIDDEYKKLGGGGSVGPAGLENWGLRMPIFVQFPAENVPSSAPGGIRFLEKNASGRFTYRIEAEFGLLGTVEYPETLDGVNIIFPRYIKFTTDPLIFTAEDDTTIRYQGHINEDLNNDYMYANLLDPYMQSYGRYGENDVRLGWEAYKFPVAMFNNGPHYYISDIMTDLTGNLFNMVAPGEKFYR